jgi:serine/threonine protein phosphatase 1
MFNKLRLLRRKLFGPNTGYSGERQIYVIGDIHGQLALLKRLIQRLPLQPQDSLIFVGDYIDRGGQSQGVVDYILLLKEKYHTVTLKGNHEQEMLDTVLHGKKSEWFARMKGEATISSYSTKLAARIKKETDKALAKSNTDPHTIKRIFQPFWQLIPASHQNFYKNLLPYYEEENFIVAHAGIPPDKDPAEITDERRFYYGSIHPVMAQWTGPQKLFMGHMPTYKLSRRYTGIPVVSANELAVALDTGAYKTGILSAVRIGDLAIFQSKNSSPFV